MLYDLYRRLKAAKSRFQVCFPHTQQPSIMKDNKRAGQLSCNTHLTVHVTTVMYTLCRHSERRQCAKGNQNHLSDQVMGKYLSWESISVEGCLPNVSELLNLIPSVWQTSKKAGASHVFVCLLPILFLHVLLNYSLFLRLECTFSCMCTVVVLLKE